MKTIPTLTVLGYWAVHTFGETTCFLLDTGKHKLLLDTCPGVCRQLTTLGISVAAVDAILLSHTHGDHMLGFPYVMFMRSVQARNLPTPVQDVKVIGNDATIAAAQQMLTLIYPDREFSAHYLSANREAIGLWDETRVLTLDVRHTVPTTGFRIEMPGVSLGFTADTMYFSELGEFFHGVDVLLLECFGTRADFGPLAQQQKHMLADDAGRLAAESNPGRVVLFHMHSPYRQAEQMDRIVDEVSQYYRGPIIVPSELMQIPLL